MGKRPGHVQMCVTGAIHFLKAARERVASRPHGHVQPTAVTDANIRPMEKLTFEKRRLKVCDIASKVCISAWSVETIIHENVLFKKVCPRWVPKMLIFEQNTRVSVCRSSERD
jgi:hypothetical protein